MAKFLVFKYGKYKKALNYHMEGAVKDIRKVLYKEIMANLGSIDFKTAPVRLEGDDYTSDAKRADSLMRSIDAKQAIDNLVWGKFRGVVSAMGTEWQDSHIGVYYEYGTGSKQRGGWDYYNGVKSRETVNAFRKGSEIVTRSRLQHFNEVRSTDYMRDRKRNTEGFIGKWKDIGGNTRVTSYPRGGERDDGFLDYTQGAETEAYRWFQRAVQKTSGQINSILIKRIEQANPLNPKFWHIEPTFILGRRKR